MQEVHLQTQLKIVGEWWLTGQDLKLGNDKLSNLQLQSVFHQRNPT